VGENYTRAVEPATRTKVDYCRKHGYNFAVLDAPPRLFGRPLSWLKIPLIFHLLQAGHQAVFALDADALVTNPEIALEPFFSRLEKSGRHLMIAEDFQMINAGSFFIRQTWQSLTLLALIFETDAEIGHHWWENQALVALLEENPDVRSLIQLELDSRQFNSMIMEGDLAPESEKELAAHGWRPGDFICHLAGFRDPLKLQARMLKVLDENAGAPR
jgi:hypothetical protein